MRTALACRGLFMQPLCAQLLHVEVSSCNHCVRLLHVEVSSCNHCAHNSCMYRSLRATIVRTNSCMYRSLRASYCAHTLLQCRGLFMQTTCARLLHCNSRDFFVQLLCSDSCNVEVSFVQPLSRTLACYSGGLFM